MPVLPPFRATPIAGRMPHRSRSPWPPVTPSPQPPRRLYARPDTRQAQQVHNRRCSPPPSTAQPLTPASISIRAINLNQGKRYTAKRRRQADLSTPSIPTQQELPRWTTQRKKPGSFRSGCPSFRQRGQSGSRVARFGVKLGLSDRLKMEPPVGVEPTTCGLRNRCSAAELRWPASVGHGHYRQRR